jgi:tetratricopeptide (TPR) repeat protein
VIAFAAFLICLYGALGSFLPCTAESQRTQTLPSTGQQHQATTASSKPSTPPDSAAGLINLGVYYSKRGLYSRAALAYKRAIKLDPRSVPAWTDLGIAYFKAGQFSAAIPPLRQVLEYAPGSFQARTLLAMSYYSLSDFGPAGSQLEVLLKAEPNNPTLQYLLAESYLHSHQEKRLLDFLHRLLDDSPRSPAVHMLVGEALDRLGRTAQAIDQLKTAEMQTPDAAHVHFALGYLYWEDRHFTPAAAEFQQEIKLNGDRARAEGYLGDIAIRGGHLAKARSLLEDAVAHDPKLRLAQYDLGVVDVSEKKYAQAEREFKRAMVLDPNQPDAYYRLAQLYRLESRTDLERRMLQKVSQLHEATRASLMEEISGESPLGR